MKYDSSILHTTNTLLGDYWWNTINRVQAIDLLYHSQHTNDGGAGRSVTHGLDRRGHHRIALSDIIRSCACMVKIWSYTVKVPIRWKMPKRWNTPTRWKMPEWWSALMTRRCLYDRRCLHGVCACTMNMMRVRVFASLFIFGKRVGIPRYVS